jgi:hypothetical protein
MVTLEERPEMAKDTSRSTMLDYTEVLAFWGDRSDWRDVPGYSYLLFEKGRLRCASVASPLAITKKDIDITSLIESWYAEKSTETKTVSEILRAAEVRGYAVSCDPKRIATIRKGFEQDIAATKLGYEYCCEGLGRYAFKVNCKGRVVDFELTPQRFWLHNDLLRQNFATHKGQEWCGV